MPVLLVQLAGNWVRRRRRVGAWLAKSRKVWVYFAYRLRDGAIFEQLNAFAMSDGCNEKARFFNNNETARGFVRSAQPHGKSSRFKPNNRQIRWIPEDNAARHPN